MAKITFTVDTDETRFAPELIAALKAADESTDLHPLYEQYGMNTVIDAMFTIDDEAHPDSQWWSMGEDQVEEWLWDEFYDNCVPNIEAAFRNRHNAECNY